MKKVSSVEEYIENHSKFSEALSLLRTIIRSTELEESIKWSAPVYSLDGKNVLGLGGFKNHFGIWFFNGVFLNDSENVLEQAQEKTKALRQMKFNSIEEVNRDVVLAYVKEAIDNQKLGKEIKPAKTSKKDILIPDELDVALKSEASLKNSFENLSTYKQKEFAEYISSAKRVATKQSRIEKIIPMIKEGIGLNDKYKNC